MKTARVQVYDAGAIEGEIIGTSYDSEKDTWRILTRPKPKPKPRKPKAKPETKTPKRRRDPAESGQ